MIKFYNNLLKPLLLYFSLSGAQLAALTLHLRAQGLQGWTREGCCQSPPPFAPLTTVLSGRKGGNAFVNELGSGLWTKSRN